MSCRGKVNAMLKKFHLKHNTNESSEDWISMYGAAQQEVQQVPRLAFTMVSDLWTISSCTASRCLKRVKHDCATIDLIYYYYYITCNTVIFFVLQCGKSETIFRKFHSSCIICFFLRQSDCQKARRAEALKGFVGTCQEAATKTVDEEDPLAERTSRHIPRTKLHWIAHNFHAQAQT